MGIFSILICIKEKIVKFSHCGTATVYVLIFLAFICNMELNYSGRTERNLGPFTTLVDKPQTLYAQCLKKENEWIQ